eukprot:CAMPEP_0114995406 /NCGR_PEP_ID=MMETSP0216-20121206/13711_1 /TAXON_ID=223996 /ORGANISM="Protocruzia adherens, Strain Boccale" /LENGTH=165 /DNA_ID=CAMNT_0002359443 /DNA_START=49 /DNA_END=546 /DNA_ORIENTATION=+
MADQDEKISVASRESGLFSRAESMAGSVRPASKHSQKSRASSRPATSQSRRSGAHKNLAVEVEPDALKKSPSVNQISTARSKLKTTGFSSTTRNKTTTKERMFATNSVISFYQPKFDDLVHMRAVAPKICDHSSGSKANSIMTDFHSRMTNAGYARNALGGFFTS